MAVELSKVEQANLNNMTEFFEQEFPNRSIELLQTILKDKATFHRCMRKAIIDSGPQMNAGVHYMNWKMMALLERQIAQKR